MRMVIRLLAGVALMFSACTNRDQPAAGVKAEPERPTRHPGAGPPGGHRPSLARISSVALSPDGKRGLSVSGDSLTLWTIPDGAVVRKLFPLPGPPLSGDTLTEGYDSERTIDHMAVNWKAGIAVTSDRKEMVRAWDLRTGALLQAIQAHPYFGYAGDVSAVALSVDGRWIYSSGLEPEKRAMVKVWDVRTGKHLQTLASIRDSGAVTYERILPLSDNRHAILVNDEDIVRWDLQKDEKVWSLAPLGTWALCCVADDGKRMLTYDGPRSRPGFGQDHLPLAVRGPDGKVLRALKFELSAKHIGAKYCFLPPDDSRVLTGGDKGDLAVWDLEEGIRTALWLPKSPGHAIGCLAVSGDGNYALAGSDDEVLQLWDLRTGSIIRDLK